MKGKKMTLLQWQGIFAAAILLALLATKLAAPQTLALLRAQYLDLVRRTPVLSFEDMREFVQPAAQALARLLGRA